MSVHGDDENRPTITSGRDACGDRWAYCRIAMHINNNKMHVVPICRYVSHTGLVRLLYQLDKMFNLLPQSGDDGSQDHD